MSQIPKNPGENSEQADGSEPSTPRRHSLSALAEPGGAKGEKLEEWMLTYMDTVTLLVTLFVLLLSFSTIAPEKFTQVAEGLSLNKYGSGIMTGSRSVIDLGHQPDRQRVPLTTPPAGLTPEPVVEPSDAMERLDSFLTDLGLGSQVELNVSDTTVDLQLRESVLFQSGQAFLLDRGKRVLSRLIPLMQLGSFRISVEGHTDSVPITSPIYPSNWELSGARAAAVVRELIELGIQPERLEMVGYADTRPISSNDTVSGRAENRRVDLVLEVSPEDVVRLNDYN